MCVIFKHIVCSTFTSSVFTQFDFHALFGFFFGYLYYNVIYWARKWSFGRPPSTPKFDWPWHSCVGIVPFLYSHWNLVTYSRIKWKCLFHMAISSPNSVQFATHSDQFDLRGLLTEYSAVQTVYSLFATINSSTVRWSINMSGQQTHWSKSFIWLKQNNKVYWHYFTLTGSQL